MIEKYRPSNGTEGMWFMSEWCDKCTIRGICKILSKTMTYDIDDPEYPHQWIRDSEGYPECTSFTDSRKPASYHCKKTADLFAEAA